MAIFTNKWTLIIGAIVVILLLLYLLGRKSVHTELTISASPQEVWKALMDPGSWNPVLIPIEGDLVEGSNIKYKFVQDENTTSEIPAKVKKIVERALLNQTGGMAGILTFDHRYILEADEDGTKVTIHEDYRGIMVPFWNPAPVEKAYEKLIKALKNKVETDNE